MIKSLKLECDIYLKTKPDWFDINKYSSFRLPPDTTYPSNPLKELWANALFSRYLLIRLINDIEQNQLKVEDWTNKLKSDPTTCLASMKHKGGEIHSEVDQSKFHLQGLWPAKQDDIFFINTEDKSLGIELLAVDLRVNKTILVDSFRAYLNAKTGKHKKNPDTYIQEWAKINLLAVIDLELLSRKRVSPSLASNWADIKNKDTENPDCSFLKNTLPNSVNSSLSQSVQHLLSGFNSIIT